MSTRSMMYLALLALLVFWTVGAYNRLIRLKNALAENFSGIDQQFKERHDLLLKLAEVCGEYLKHDPALVSLLMQARGDVSAALDALRARPHLVRLAQKLMAQENTLNQRLEQVWAAARESLAMQAEPKFREVTQQLSVAQNKLDFACQGFNASVSAYNAAQSQFPTLLIARMFGFSVAAHVAMGAAATGA